MYEYNPFDPMSNVKMLNDHINTLLEPDDEPSIFLKAISKGMEMYETHQYKKERKEENEGKPTYNYQYILNLDHAIHPTKVDYVLTAIGNCIKTTLTNPNFRYEFLTITNVKTCITDDCKEVIIKIESTDENLINKKDDISSAFHKIVLKELFDRENGLAHLSQSKWEKENKQELEGLDEDRIDDEYKSYTYKFYPVKEESWKMIREPEETVETSNKTDDSIKFLKSIMS